MTFQACHELTETNGKTEFAYMGAKPWHGLGQVISEGATVEETQVAAGMAWRIERAPVQYGVVNSAGAFPMPELREAPGRVVLFRSDTLAPLSVVSSRFHEVQPVQALEFFRDMVEAGGYSLESAGTMRGGARLFATVRPAQSFELPGGDEVQGRLLFATACDGSMATSVRQVSIRVVCKNTLNAAIGASPDCVTVRHSSKINAAAMKIKLREVSASFDALRSAAEVLAATSVSSARFANFLEKLLPAPRDSLVEDSRAYKKMVSLFQGVGMGSRLVSSAGTAWGALNAVTQYVDHEVVARSAENRQESAVFGAGAALKTRALQLLAA